MFLSRHFGFTKTDFTTSLVFILWRRFYVNKNQLMFKIV